jgi:ankyrin repeat protein
MFSDFSELLALPLPVQKQLLSALVGIAEEPKWRKAEACYALTVFYILRIGTIRPNDPENLRGGFTGYHLDAGTSLKWLKKAARLGSRKAQAIYYRMNEALGIAVSSTELSEIKLWLADAVREGSRIASEDLKKIDEGLWTQARSVLKSAYWSNDLKLQEEAVYRAIATQDLNGFTGLASNFITRKTILGDSLLHCASISGFVGGVVYLLTELSAHVHVNAVNNSNETALLQACRPGHSETVQVLLSASADASLCTDCGENPLHWLCSFDGSENEIFNIASRLVSAGASVDQSCKRTKVCNPIFSGELLAGTPLRRVTGLNNKAAVKALLQLGADPYDGGADNDPPIVEACLAHYDEILELFLPPNFGIRHPGWYKQPLMRKRDILEAVFATFGRPKSMALGAPRAWANMERQGNAKSLLGYAVNPKLLHERMVLHGGRWKARMRDTINSILEKGEEDYLRVSPANSSAILEAVLSGDVEIVSHLLDSCPEVLPLLPYPRPNGYSFWLPIHGAIAQQNKAVFDRLLQAAGPGTALSCPQRSGFSNWIQSKALEAGGQTIGTCPPGQQFSTVLHLCANATIDPYFAEVILNNISDPRTLVMTPGHFGEMPLTAAICNQSFALAELFVESGAHPEFGGRPGPRMGAMAAGIGLSWSAFLASTLSNMSLEGGQSPLAWVLRLNNEASTAGVEWLLSRGASFIVDEATQLSALHLAVQGGHRFNLEEESMEQMFFYECNLTNLKLVLQHFSKPEELDFRDGLMGYTAVHWAVFQRDIEALKILKKAGARLDVRSDKGLAPLQLVEMLAEVPRPVKTRGRKAVVEYHERIEKLKELLGPLM